MTLVTLRAAPAAKGWVEVWLIGSGGQKSGALDLTADKVLLDRVARVQLDATGLATVELLPTASITPAGTAYRADFNAGGVKESLVFAGFTGDGPVEATDYIVDVPGALAPAALAVETAARIAADDALTADVATRADAAATTAALATKETPAGAQAKVDTLGATLPNVYVPRSLLTTDGDLLTRTAGVAARTTRTALAADVAFAEMAYRSTGGVPSPRNTALITTMQAGHGFTILASTAASMTDDTADFALGSQSVAVVVKSDGTAGSIQKLGVPAIDATNRSIRFWVKVSDITNLAELSVYVGTGGFAAYYQWNINDTTMAQRYVKSGEWVSIVLNPSEATVVGAPNRAALTDIRFRARANTGFTPTIRYNGLALVDYQTRYPNGVVSVVFDDIYASQWTIGRRVLDAYGYPGTMYGLPGREAEISNDQLRQLETANGWEVAGHGAIDLTTLTLTQVEQEMRNTRAWLRSNGFSGIDHYAYPGGGFSPDIERIMRRYFRTGRTIISRSKVESVPPANPYRLRCRSVTNVSVVANITAEIDQAVAGDGWYILAIHDIVAANATLGTQILTATFEALVAHIAGTGAAVRTVGDVLAGIAT